MKVSPDAELFGITHVGKIQQVNGDEFFVGELQKSVRPLLTSLSDYAAGERLLGATQGYLLIVADGQRAKAAVTPASALAVKSACRYVVNLMPWFFRQTLLHEDEIESELVSLLRFCQAELQHEGESVGDEQPAAAAMTLAYISGTRIFLAHVGNSRGYVFREERLERITAVHSITEQMQQAGLITREEQSATQTAASDTDLWNAVGGSEMLSPEVHIWDLQEGDVVLLCTDGVSKHVDDRQIADLLKDIPQVEQACRKLIETAIENGGTDNVTAVAARFTGFDAFEIDELP